jgi:hypothetical protein
MSFAHDFSVTQTASHIRDQIGSLVNSATVVTLSAQGTRAAIAPPRARARARATLVPRSRKRTVMGVPGNEGLTP